jgi:hypothetical protein
MTPADTHNILLSPISFETSATLTLLSHAWRWRRQVLFNCQRRQTPIHIQELDAIELHLEEPAATNRRYEV